MEKIFDQIMNELNLEVTQDMSEDDFFAVHLRLTREVRAEGFRQSGALGYLIEKQNEMS